MNIILEKKILFSTSQSNVEDISIAISTKLGLNLHEYYLVQNGHKITENVNDKNDIHVVLRVFGGKGGFGSMLRAIGAQIEKTTNREACRDLSGRRLRDINEEKRLKNWISQQADREKEALARKKKKLEKLCEQPKYEFKDEVYDKERSALPEKVEDAVLHGLQASSSGGSKRKGVESKTVKKKKPKLWVDDEMDELSSSNDDSSEDEENSEKRENSDNSKDSKKSNEVTQVIKDEDNHEKTEKLDNSTDSNKCSEATNIDEKKIENYVEQTKHRNNVDMKNINVEKLEVTEENVSN